MTFVTALGSVIVDTLHAYGSGYRPHMQYPLVESYLPGQQPRPGEAAGRVTAEQSEVDDAD